MPEQFLDEIRMPVADGSSEVGDVSSLTPRERQVLAEIMAGASNKEAGRTLGISPRTDRSASRPHHGKARRQERRRPGPDRAGAGASAALEVTQPPRRGLTTRRPGAALIAPMASSSDSSETRMAARRRNAVDRDAGRHHAELAGFSRRPCHRLAARGGDGGAVRPAGAYPGAAVARHFGAGRHFARRRGDAGDAQGPRGISAERSGAGDFDAVHDHRDQLLSPLRPRLGRAIGAVRRKPRRARPGDDARVRIQGGPPRHRHRADHARGGADPRHSRRAGLLRADGGGRRPDGALHRGRPAVAGRACHPGRCVHRHGAGVFQAAAAGRADVRRHAGVRRPARRRLHPLDPALVGGLCGGDRHRRGHRLAVRQHRSVHVAPLPRRGAGIVRGGDGGCVACPCWRWPC